MAETSGSGHSNGTEHIRSRLRYFEEQNEDAAAALWREIGSRFEALNPTGIEK
ncbi:DUF6961 family protein [Croceicoccus mobilis]|uniref:DUF6961 family protein n=1 Tax=Croceicoccus mobilis TaxID=1703339 RepID=UPI0035711704